MTVQMNTQIQRVEHSQNSPSDAQILRWADTVRERFNDDGDVTIRLVGLSEMCALNRDYRGKDQPTNVLSFAVDEQTRALHGLLGDVVICIDVVVDEAIEHGKKLDAHFAHMVTHGLLHLMGFDHIEDADAEIMEAHEIACLAEHHFANPYLEQAPMKASSAR